MRRLTCLYIFFFVASLTGCCISYQNATSTILLPNAKYAQSNAREGLNYLRSGNTPLAYEKLQLAYEQNPKDPLVIQSLGYYFEKSGDIDTANQYYTYALTVDPHSSEAVENYAVFLCRNGYYELSVEYFRRRAFMKSQSCPREVEKKAQYCRQEMKRALGDKATWAYYMAK